MITLTNVTKDYKTITENVTVLKNITLRINEGEFISIMGPSGSGKSTLLNILGCLDKPTSGTFEIKGEDMTTLDNNLLSKVRRENIGFVFQSFNLLARLSVLDNVILPLIYQGVERKKRKDLALNALEKVGLTGFEKKYPTQISGGQKQRVAIARALVIEPQFLIADEPTGSLDSENTNKIMNLLSSLNSNGTTIILVTHEDEVTRYTSRKITLKDGLIVSDTKKGSEMYCF